MTIDLHGMTSQEAVQEVLVSLISFDSSPHETTLEIITGKGNGVLMFVTQKLLDEEDRHYDIEEGRVIVYKDFKDEDDIHFTEEIDSYWDDIQNDDEFYDDDEY